MIRDEIAAEGIWHDHTFYAVADTYTVCVERFGRLAMALQSAIECWMNGYLEGNWHNRILFCDLTSPRFMSSIFTKQDMSTP